MKVNVAMWKQALSHLVIMQEKREWDGLDVLSKWLIATRSAVTFVTVYSALAGGLLALQYAHAHVQPFSIVTWAVLIVGLFVAHGANNLINDFTDYVRGVDSDNYFRTQYGVHPLVQGFWGKRTQLAYFAASGLIAAMTGVYALAVTDWSPVVWALIVAGALILLFYTWPLKYLAVGELSIFVVWGPLMVTGVFFVLTGVWSWTVVLASVPLGLVVAAVNVGKHADKRSADAAKGVHTLPVLIGEPAARYLAIACILVPYLVVAWLIFAAHLFTPVLLLILLAAKPAWTAVLRLSRPRPAEAPAGYRLWPLWLSHVGFLHDRVFSNWFILALAIDTLLRIVTPGFWPFPAAGW